MMGRTHVRLIVRVVIFAAWASGVFLAGCGASAEVAVQVARTCPDGVKVRCMDHAKLGIVADERYEAADQAERDHCTVDFLRGTLLTVEFGDTEDLFKDPTFALIDPGDPSPWAFSHEAFAALLNGRRIALDLTGEGAAAWLARQPDAALRPIRTISIDGRRPGDLVALRRFAGSGVLVQVDHFPPPADRRGFVEALVRVRPRGLVLAEPADLDDVLPRLTELTHLVMQGPAPADIRVLRKLRFLAFDFKDVAAPSLAPLTWMASLRFLAVSQCGRVADFAPIGTLHALESLTLIDSGELTHLGAWSDLERLRTLVVIDSGLKDLSGLRRFAGLSTLGIVPTPSDEGLRHVAALKHLKVLVVSKDDMECEDPTLKGFGDARPDVEIVGFCLGSAWTLAVAGLGIGVGLMRRRARRR